MTKIYKTKDGYDGIFTIDLSKVVCFRTYTDCYGAFTEHLEIFFAPAKFGEPVKFEFIISSWHDREKKEENRKNYIGYEILKDLVEFFESK